MEYLSKSFRLDEEVVAWLEKLKAEHGSVNKGLRLVAFASGAREATSLDVTGVALIGDLRGKATIETVTPRPPERKTTQPGRSWKGPLEKPSAKREKK